MDNVREQVIDGIRTKVELEAEDTLAVLLKGMRLEGPGGHASVRSQIETQARAIVEQVTYLSGDLSVIEVDGVANAVQIRTRNPERGRFIEVILRNGNLITVEARGGSVHLSRDNYQRLVETLVGLLK
jgi:hypothetical protein